MVDVGAALNSSISNVAPPRSSKGEMLISSVFVGLIGAIFDEKVCGERLFLKVGQDL